MEGDLEYKRIGQYDIKKRIGTGASGDVYEAFDTILKRSVAFKIQHEDLAKNQPMRELFEEEAKKAAQLDHSNIVKIYELGNYEGRPFFTMEYMPGGSLKRRLLNKGPFDTKKALETLLRITNAIAFAHKKEFIHRDLKSDNILYDLHENPKVTDFGIARAGVSSAPGFTIGYGPIGTPEYMAPEQIDGKARQASDLYSLGIILFEMLTGSVPFSGNNPVEIFQKHLKEDVPLKPLRNKHVLDAVQKLVLDLLEKNPDNRITNCEKLIRRIENLLKKNEKKFPFLTLGIGLLIVVMVTAGTVLCWRFLEPTWNTMVLEVRGWFHLKNHNLPLNLLNTWSGYDRMRNDVLSYTFCENGIVKICRGKQDSSKCSFELYSSQQDIFWMNVRYPSGEIEKCLAEIINGNTLRVQLPFKGNRPRDINNDAIVLTPAMGDTSSREGAFSLKISWSGPGTLLAKPQKAIYRFGSKVTLTAKPSSKSVFSGWSGDLSGNENPITIIMDFPKHITAIFQNTIIDPSDTFREIKTISQGPGSVNPSKGRFKKGSQVTLTARPQSEKDSFAEWKGDLIGQTNPASLLVDDNKTITAIFIKKHVEPPISWHKDMTRIRGGTFQFGDDYSIGDENEEPVVEKEVKSYFLDTQEVNQRNFKAKMGINPSARKGDDLPVTNVSWANAQKYCESIGKRLPNEVEWEYAAKTGGGRYPWGNSRNTSSAVCATSAPSLVGSYRQGSYLLYDMGGNVAEWCLDPYRASHSESTPASEGEYVVKGGSFKSSLHQLRSSAREGRFGGNGYEDVGFRCVHD